MKKKIRRKTLLRHTRIQSFCAVAGLALVFVNAPEIIAKVLDIIEVSKPDISIGEAETSDGIDFVVLPNGTKISSKPISKKTYSDYLSEHDLDTDLPELSGSLQSPAHNINWPLAKDICRWIGGKNQLSSLTLPSHRDWTIANQAGLLRDTNSEMNEWVDDYGCDDSPDQHCYYRKVAGGAMSSWNIKDSRYEKLRFRCAQLPSNAQVTSNTQSPATRDFNIKQMLQTFFTISIAARE